MFLAHLPAGYLLSHALLHVSRLKPIDPKPYVLAGMVGSIAPDLDLIWHAWGDPHPVFHHLYWTHYPFAWAVVTLPLLLMLLALGQRAVALGLMIFTANGFGHLLLDTVWGSIAWGWPLSPTLIRWVAVPRNHRYWVLNFALHWTALLELGIIGAAAVLWRGKRRDARLAKSCPPSASNTGTPPKAGRSRASSARPGRLMPRAKAG